MEEGPLCFLVTGYIVTFLDWFVREYLYKSKKSRTMFFDEAPES